MDTVGYTIEVMKTCRLDTYERLAMMGGLGLTGEAGEVADIIKKQVFHEHAPDKQKICKELGDVMWYVTVIAEVYGLTLDEIMVTNIAKLRARYPKGFDPERSINRVDS